VRLGLRLEDVVDRIADHELPALTLEYFGYDRRTFHGWAPPVLTFDTLHTTVLIDNGGNATFPPFPPCFVRPLLADRFVQLGHGDDAAVERQVLGHVELEAGDV